MKQPLKQSKFTSLSGAARAAGKSRATIQRAIKAGKISASKDENGNYCIDVSELNRVYPLQKDETGEMLREHVYETLRNSKNETVKQSEISILQAELAASRQMIEERGKTIEDLRTRLDTAEERRDEAVRAKDEAQTKLTALLSDMRPDTSSKSSQRILERLRYWAVFGMTIAFVVFLWAFSQGLLPVG